ncbi:hypothetical protein KR215_007778 [Drosophila sulfurigaster]|nr:hypothetical protein KR215_007778 [Drosophila sulfurigaster]
MDKLKILLLLLVIHLLTPNFGVLTGATEASGMLQFLEQNSNENEDSLNWTHLLPSNYYSELNQQYYLRFRRRSKLSLMDLRRSRSYPFESAFYI